MNTTLRSALRASVESRGWRSGSDLEDRAARLLHRYGLRPDVVSQQHRVGPYRLDFAWVEDRIDLEIDGFRHLYDPATARKDAERDAYLRERGWLIFRVHDTEDTGKFEAMLARTVAAIRGIGTGHFGEFGA